MGLLGLVGLVGADWGEWVVWGSMVWVWGYWVWYGGSGASGSEYGEGRGVEWCGVEWSEYRSSVGSGEWVWSGVVWLCKIAGNFGGHLGAKNTDPG